MEVLTYNSQRKDTSIKTTQPVGKFALVVANVGVMRCPIDSNGDVLDGIWLNENELIQSLDETIQSAKQVIQDDAILDTVNSLSSRTFIDDTLLFENDDAVVWYTKAHSKLNQFYTNETVLNVPHPQLVFFASKHHSRLAVIATNEISRPNLDSSVFHCPLANIYDDSHLCIGTATLPKSRSGANLQEIQDCLLGSRYSGFKLISVKGVDNLGKLKQFWKNLEGEEKFPTDLLVEFRSNISLSDWITLQFSAIGSDW